MDGNWQADLERWVAPFAAALRHKTKARMCPAYVAGLIGPGDRKSIQPMAARDGTVSYDRLHHFIGSGVWDAAPLEAVLLAEADKMVGGGDAWLIVDDTALPKKGRHSVGRVIASGARFGYVLADSGYGSSGPFRQALSERGLKWAVGLSRRQNVYPADVTLIFPVAKTGRRRKYHIPDRPPVSAEAMLADEKWQKVSWRRGTKGRLSCLFAACRVRVADGHKHRMLDGRV